MSAMHLKTVRSVAQNYAVFTSVCLVMSVQLVTVRSGLLKLCVKIYAVFRSPLCIIKCS